MVVGLLITTLFVVFILIGQDPAEGLKTAMWIGVAFGGLLVLFGLYRMLKGPSPRDHLGGGSKSEPDT